MTFDMIDYREMLAELDQLSHEADRRANEALAIGAILEAEMVHRARRRRRLRQLLLQQIEQLA